MSDDDFAASFVTPDDTEDDGHAGEDLDLDAAMVDTLKGRFGVLVKAVKAMRAEMRIDRKEKNRRIFRLEMIVFGISVVFGTATYALHYYTEMQHAGLIGTAKAGGGH